MEIALIFVLLAFLGVREWMHDRRERDLLDRLMSKDFDQYKAQVDPEENEFEDGEDESLSLDDAFAEGKLDDG